MYTFEQLDKLFNHHPPTGNKGDRHQNIRFQCGMLARIIQNDCPDSEETKTALMKLQETMMWANAAIAREGL